MDNTISNADSNSYDNRYCSGVSGITEQVIKEAAGAVQPEEKDGDYRKDGLLYCGKCDTKKQTRIMIAGREAIVCCICKCEAERKEQEKKRMEHEEEMRRIERLKNASLMDAKMRNATLRTFTRKPDNQKLYTIVKNYVDNFETFFQKNRGILFWGTVGSGKTYAAACIANELLNQSVSVIMTSFVKILPQLQDFNTDESDIINKLNVARLLIIDDLGTERTTDYALEKVYNVIDSRYRTGKPLILTTNLNYEDMQQTQDIRYRRIYDRILEMCHPVQVSGRSWRVEQALDRFKETSKLLEG